ncbi:class I histocompatibility antigen, F10 alpha chain-like [Chanos chanos]|uniref:Class I histocompatibility antigen, F10 alpha chain-like n=1 Tax=Chanos chanos TaxID=29144 RepID=A0A6J2UP08_CHACN|nr:class I histocompatibility antigen, F10 alpha chain-like [Chanos chanos]
MLDDVQLGYYDSADRRYVCRRPHTNSEDYDSEQKDAAVVFGSMFEDIKYTTTRLKKQFNSTNVIPHPPPSPSEEIDVFQRITGCELLDGDVPGQVKLLDYYSGFARDLQEMNFNSQKKTLVWSMDSIIDWRIYTESGAKAVLENIYHPICIKSLRRYFQREKRYLLRKVKPRVRLLKKTLTHSTRTQVTCLATGFYPRHINLTLLRDGQPVPEDQLTGGLLLPNTDGTYQMRKSLEVSAGEVKCNYTCIVTHLSLDNKLDISIDYDPGPSILPIVLFVLVALFVLVMIPIAGCIVWKKCAVKLPVSILQKALRDSGGIQVTCLATGFYPRHINLTLLTDGQPLFEGQISEGMLLPNADGTYQVRECLKISEDELRERHKYTCTATHLSLDNKLDIHIDYDP